MKKLLYIVGILILTSCQDVIDVDVPVDAPRLVIDATFELFLDENPVTLEGGVRLTLSTPFFDTDTQTVSNATVFMTDLNNDVIINFEESSELGLYAPQNPAFIPQFDTDYELTVIYNSETYNATTSLIPTVPIDQIEQGDGTLFGGDEKEVIISFNDDGSRDDFYLFDFDFNLFLPSDDRFYQGESFNFSYFYEDLEPEQEVTIKILGITEAYFNYSTLLIEQSDPDSNGPFAVPPARIRGNIINTTDPNNFPLGYFNLSQANRSTFTIQE